MRNAKALFRYDPATYRIDLQPAVVAVIYAILDAAWSVAGAETAGVLLTRLAVGALFILALHTLFRLTASTHAGGAVAVAVALGLLARLSSVEMYVLFIYIVAVVMWLTYFRWPARLAAFGLGAVNGLLAALLGSSGQLLVILFIAAMLSRTAWHFVLERMSRRVMFMYGGKAVVACLLTLGVYMALRGTGRYPVLFEGGISWPKPAWWLLAVSGLLALRGLWAMLLLKTRRSPSLRGLRWFMIVFGGVTLVALVLLHAYAARLFVSSVATALDLAGLTGLTLNALVFPLLAFLLLVQAAADRSFYKDATLGRHIVPGLAPAARRAAPPSRPVKRRENSDAA